ncbi:MAG: hypothetical protein N0C84_01115 [Candidatus Thiodiazotropha taylori]|uniref:Uncharacterized protein n=1 Tax=Candidatus Thiodiazotropha taylori TaxID=2792791 RepID=A0A9E4KAD3_9GAMM|nr:hypothetical protein [Candidatus Thiodiazotropha taylori]MCW4255046.1 hypothetical protein [Candidatus Thiodiazotropha taylori]
MTANFNIRLSKLAKHGLKFFKTIEDADANSALLYPDEVFIVTETMILYNVESNNVFTPLADLSEIKARTDETISTFNPEVEYSIGEIVYYKKAFYICKTDKPIYFPGGVSNPDWKLFYSEKAKTTELSSANFSELTHWNDGVFVDAADGKNFINLTFLKPPINVATGGVLRLQDSAGRYIDDVNVLNTSNNAGFKTFDVYQSASTESGHLEIKFAIDQGLVDELKRAAVTLGINYQEFDVGYIEYDSPTHGSVVHSLEASGANIYDGTVIEPGEIYKIDEYSPVSGKNLAEYHSPDLTSTDFNYFEDNQTANFKALSTLTVDKNLLEKFQEVFGNKAPPYVQTIEKGIELVPNNLYDFKKVSEETFIWGDKYNTLATILSETLEVESGTGLSGDPIVMQTQEIDGFAYKYTGDTNVVLDNKDIRDVRENLVRAHDGAASTLPPVVKTLRYGSSYVENDLVMFVPEEIYGLARDGNMVDWTDYNGLDYTNMIYRVKSSEFIMGGSSEGPVDGKRWTDGDDRGRFNILANYHSDLKDNLEPYAGWVHEFPDCIEPYKPGTWEEGDLVFISNFVTPKPWSINGQKSAIKDWTDTVSAGQTFRVTQSHQYASNEDIWTKLPYLTNIDEDSSVRQVLRWEVVQAEDIIHEVKTEKESCVYMEFKDQSTSDASHYFKLSDYTPVEIALVAPGGSGGNDNGGGGGGGAYFHGELLLPPGTYNLHQGQATAPGKSIREVLPHYDANTAYSVGDKVWFENFQQAYVCEEDVLPDFFGDQVGYMSAYEILDFRAPEYDGCIEPRKVEESLDIGATKANWKDFGKIKGYKYWRTMTASEIPEECRNSAARTSYLSSVDGGYYIVKAEPGNPGAYGVNGFSRAKDSKHWTAENAGGGAGGTLSGAIFNEGSDFYINGGQTLQTFKYGQGGEGGRSSGSAPLKYGAEPKIGWHQQWMLPAGRWACDNYEVILAGAPGWKTPFVQNGDFPAFREMSYLGQFYHCIWESYVNNFPDATKSIVDGWLGDHSDDPGDGYGGVETFRVSRFKDGYWMKGDLGREGGDNDIDVPHNFKQWTAKKNRWKSIAPDDHMSNNNSYYNYVWPVKTSQTAIDEFSEPTLLANKLDEWSQDKPGICGGGGGALNPWTAVAFSSEWMQLPGAGKTGGGRAAGQLLKKEMLRYDVFGKKAADGFDFYKDARKMMWGSLYHRYQGALQLKLEAPIEQRPENPSGPHLMWRFHTESWGVWQGHQTHDADAETGIKHKFGFFDTSYEVSVADFNASKGTYISNFKDGYRKTGTGYNAVGFGAGGGAGSSGQRGGAGGIGYASIAVRNLYN